jgi:hypothetical protein
MTFNDWDATVEESDMILEVNLITPNEAPVICHSTLSQDSQLASLLHEFQDIFTTPTTLPPPRPEDHHITFAADAKLPPPRGITRLAETELAVLRTKLDELLAKGYITPSKSHLASRILFAKKQDGTLRLCVDYRDINDITIKDRTSLPHSNEIRQRLQGATHMSTLDLRDGYHNILVRPEDRHKTAFKTRYGLFEYRVLPFGLCNAPGTFVRMMNRVFQELMDNCVITWVDDIVVYSVGFDNHLRDLRKVCTLLRQNQLPVKLPKCVFNQPSVNFGGLVVSGQGVHTNPTQVNDLLARQYKFRNPKDIQTFIGACTWFKDFIPEYAEVALPLTNLLQKDSPWEWNISHQTAVIILQFRIANAPTLSHFDPLSETQIFTDASNFAIGGWIGQINTSGELHPIVFWSRKLSGAETRYPVHERELLALVELCKKHRHLLVGRPVASNVDHRSIQYLQKQPHLSLRQAGWVESLQEFDLTVRYIPGPENHLADLLSRCVEYEPRCGECGKYVPITAPLSDNHQTAHSTTIVHSTIPDVVRKLLAEDKLAKQLSSAASNPKLQSADQQRLLNRFHRQDGLWYVNNRLYIPTDTQLQYDILRSCHDTPTSGHQGISRTYEKLARSYFWPNMIESVRSYVSSCDSCQRFKPSQSSPAGLLHPLPIPEQRFQTITTDAFDMPISSDGFNRAYIIVDKLSKLTCFFPGNNTDTAEDFARSFLAAWVLQGKGTPTTIISDRGSQFTSNFWQALCHQLKIEISLSTARHQESDGQSEIGIKTAKTILKHYADYSQGNWTTHLKTMEFAVNDSVSASTGFTPFFLAFGLYPQILPSPIPSSSNPTTTDLLVTLQQTLTMAKTRIRKSQESQKFQADKHRSTPPSYEPGDLVLLKSDGLTWDPNSHRPKPDTDLWLGPFAVIGYTQHPDNVELRLPPSMSRIHPVFHTRLLKPYVNPSTFPHRPSHARPDPVIIGNEAFFEVEHILDTKLIRRKRHFLIKFRGFPESDNEWLPASNKTSNPVEYNREQEFLRLNPPQASTIDWVPPPFPSVKHPSGGTVMDIDVFTRSRDPRDLIV